MVSLKDITCAEDKHCTIECSIMRVVVHKKRASVSLSSVCLSPWSLFYGQIWSFGYVPSVSFPLVFLFKPFFPLYLSYQLNTTCPIESKYLETKCLFLCMTTLIIDQSIIQYSISIIINYCYYLTKYLKLLIVVS